MITTPRSSFGDTTICWHRVPLPTHSLSLTRMLTKEKTVGGLAVGKGIADRSSLADTFSDSIHPTYADSMLVDIHPTYPDIWFVGIHPRYADSSGVHLHPTFVDTYAVLLGIYLSRHIFCLDIFAPLPTLMLSI